MPIIVIFKKTYWSFTIFYRIVVRCSYHLKVLDGSKTWFRGFKSLLRNVISPHCRWIKSFCWLHNFGLPRAPELLKWPDPELGSTIYVAISPAAYINKRSGAQSLLNNSRQYQGITIFSVTCPKLVP